MRQPKTIIQLLVISSFCFFILSCSNKGRISYQKNKNSTVYNEYFLESDYWDYFPSIDLKNFETQYDPNSKFSVYIVDNENDKFIEVNSLPKTTKDSLTVDIYVKDKLKGTKDQKFQLTYPSNQVSLNWGQLNEDNGETIVAIDIDQKQKDFNSDLNEGFVISDTISNQLILRNLKTYEIQEDLLHVYMGEFKSPSEKNYSKFVIVNDLTSIDDIIKTLYLRRLRTKDKVDKLCVTKIEKNREKLEKENNCIKGTLSFSNSERHRKVLLYNFNCYATCNKR